MAKKVTVASLNVGSTQTTTAIANLGSDNTLWILGVGVVPSRGIQKGVVVNIDDTKEAICESVKLAERGCGLKVESVYVSLSGKHINSLNNHSIVAIARNDRLVTSDDLKRVMESARSISIPNERKLLHVIPTQYTLDGQVIGAKSPVGMHGFRLDVETHIVTAAYSSVQNMVKAIRGAGLEIEDLVFQSLAAAEAVVTPDEKDIGVILADIGGGTTDIAIFKNGSIWHTAVLPVGGNQVTRDIAIGLAIPFDVAEESKKKYANLMISSVNHKAELKDVKTEENGQSVLHQDLCEIARARVEEILRMIVLELPRSEYASLLPAGLVLTGGSANMPGIVSMGQEALRIPVRVGTPINKMFGISDVLYDPAHASTVGLLLWQAKKNESDEVPPAPSKWHSISKPLKHIALKFIR